ncbi:MAG: hypothetical protein A2X45_07000 [Lentisphaerae bacterium GWF2_50_93]|nr:MAG: hypothetical protein A2X45_07000 [Lentisphaerae bacterium GWF2_50_93]
MAEKKKKSFFRKLLLPAAIILLLLIFLRIYIPFYIENNLCEKIRQSLKVGDVSCKVRSFGFSHLDISDVSVGEGKTPFLTVDSIRIDYPVLGIFRRGVSMSGLNFNAGYREGKLYIPGLRLDDLMGGKSDGGKPSKNAIPGLISSLMIRNSSVNFNLGDKTHIIPFELLAHSTENGEYELNINLYPRGEPIFITSSLDSALKKVSGGLKTKNLDLARFQDITDKVKGLKISAVADIDSDFDISGDASLQIRLSDLDMQYKGLRITNSTDDDGKPEPFIMQVSKKGNSIPFTFNAFRMQAPFPVDFSMDAPGGELKISKDGVTVATEIKVKIDKAQFNGRFKATGFQLAESEMMTLLFDAGIDRKLSWHFNFSALHDRNESVELEGADRSITCNPELMSLSGDGDDHSATVNYVFKVSGTELRKKDGMSVILPSMEFSGVVKADVPASPLLESSSKLVLENISAGPAKCDKMEIVLPFQWPFVLDAPKIGESNAGAVTTSQLSSGNNKLGTFEAVLKQSGDLSWKIDGAFQTVIDNLKVKVDGDFGMKEPKGICCDIGFETLESVGSKAMNFGKVNPAFSGISLDGNFKTKGNVVFEGGILRTNADITMKDSVLDAPSRNLKVEGLQLKLSFQDLVLLKSLPKQNLKFSRLTAGNIQMETGRIDFQIESPAKYFIERSSFSWCGGHVYAPAMRVVPGEDMRFILYCDRLNLSSFLQQMNIAEASGDGTVNGRIPITLGKGKLKIRDGFLYSTPGVGGVINFSKSDVLQVAMSAQDGVSITSFLMDVLKNFKYDWAKISLNSEAEDLKLLLQISGIPADKFAYNASDDSFTKIEKDEGDIVRFQGIQYDINFYIPFNTLMGMQSDFNKIIQGGGE